MVWYRVHPKRTIVASCVLVEYLLGKATDVDLIIRKLPRCFVPHTVVKQEEEKMRYVLHVHDNLLGVLRLSKIERFSTHVLLLVSQSLNCTRVVKGLQNSYNTLQCSEVALE